MVLTIKILGLVTLVDKDSLFIEEAGGSECLKRSDTKLGF